MNPIDTLNRWAGLWAGFMGERLIDGTVVFLAVGGLWLLLHRKASPQLGYGLFLLVLAKLLIPFEEGRYTNRDASLRHSEQAVSDCRLASG